MPRPGPKRPKIAVRMSQETIDALDAQAAFEEVPRSEVIRRAVDLYLNPLENHG